MTLTTHIAPTVLAAFLASLVECVEALTVVLAVGIVRGWRFALSGAAVALLVLLALVAAIGPSLQRIPLVWVQASIGTLALLFGLRWLRKAILRSAGAIPLHDESQEFAKTSTLLRGLEAARRTAWDPIAFAAAFKIVMLEGIEVVFIVVALGANNRLLWPATVGAAGALLAVVVLGITVHRPLARIPENSLKFAVGVLLASFGTFWVGEGLHLQWPGGDQSLPALIAAYLLCALVLVAMIRRRIARTAAREVAPPSTAGGPAGPLRLAGVELAAMFVDDRWLAAGVIVWIVAAYAGGAQTLPVAATRCIVFFAGIAGMLAASAGRAAVPRAPAA